MGSLKTLSDIVLELDSLDDEAIIYAAKPWSPEAMALVSLEPPSGGLPADAAASGMKYFIEVAVAREFLDKWAGALDHAPSVPERCDRLIRYAIADA